MSSSSSSSSSSSPFGFPPAKGISWRKAPALDPEDFAGWEMMFKAYVGYAEWELFRESEPRVTQEQRDTMVESDGSPTAALTALLITTNIKFDRWKANNDNIRQKLVESLCENKQTKLMALEFQDLPTPAFYAALEKRLKDTSSQSLNYHTGILNRLTCLSNETRMEYVDRLVSQFLVVLSLGGKLDAQYRLERLLNGLKACDKYKQEANVLELLPGQTWDSVTNQLRSYDRADTHLRKESANVASPIICHVCHTSGHKANDCPQRAAQRGGKGRGGRKGGGGRGNYSGGKGGGGRGNYGGKGGWKPKGGKGGYNSNNSRVCYCCRKAGHQAQNCPHAQEFAKLLEKRKDGGGTNLGAKRAKKGEDEDAEDVGEYSFMMQNVQDSSCKEGCFSAYTAVLDSGCSSHTIKKSCLPVETQIDSSSRTHIQTALAGATLESLGRASKGIVKKALVISDKKLAKNLASISKLDRLGYTTTFCNGKGVVTDRQGNIITSALLTDDDLYEFDIRELFEAEHAMLSSANLDENDESTWHLRLGHRNVRDLRLAVKKNLITGVPLGMLKSKKRAHTLCDPCVRAKSTKFVRRKKSRPSHVDQKNDSSNINDDDAAPELVPDSSDDESDDDELEGVPVGRPRDIAKAHPVSNFISCIFTDLKGPFQTAGIKGETYAQSYIEEESKYLRRYYFNYKSQAAENLRDLLDVKLKAEGSRLLCYCSDGAPELISRDCVKQLANHGSKFMYAPPYSPTHNSIVERNHRTTFESAHAMLNDCGLPAIFWVYASEYATLIYNFLPTETAFGYMSPVQARYGLVPDVSRLRRFGCICYCHIPSQTRDKGFVDKAYKCYFLGFDSTTQAYIVWVIDMNVQRITADVLFDEALSTKIQLSNITVPTAPVSKNVKDFSYLIGMVYRDDEDKLLYVTRRVVVQRGEIVCFRCVYLSDVVGQEEPRPIHVADVERMLRVYLLDNTPGVVLPDDVSATKVDVLRRLPGVEPTSDSVARHSVAAGEHSVAHTNIFESDAKHTRVDPSGEDSKSKRVASVDVQRTPVGQEESSATTVQKTSLTGPSTSSVSHRFPRSSHNKPRYAVEIGNKEEHSMYAQFSYDGDIFDLYMPNLSHCASEYAFLSQPPRSPAELEKWKEADLSEIKSMVLEHNVWDVREPPTTANLITNKWVRSVKNNGVYKSRLCGRGFNMIQGVDYNETFAPVAKMVTMRIFLTLVAIYSLFTGSLDIKTAFLNAPMTDDVWMEPPSNLLFLLGQLLLDPSLTSGQRSRILRHVKHLKRGEKLKLLKALYGTKQAGREWYIMIDKFLKDLGFVPNKADHCFYTLVLNSNDYVLLLLYVDDVIIAATSEELTLRYVQIIGKRFRISFSGELDSYLNIGIKHDRATKTIYLSQEKYIEEMIAQFEIPEDSSVVIPMQENLKLLSTEEENTTPRQLRYVARFPYRKLIGAIIYLNVCTRPAISYAISILSQFNASPTFLACKALVWLAKYLFNTRRDRLALGSGAQNPAITSFCDSDWGGCVNTRYSRSGHITYCGNGPVVWYSRRQTNVAQSSAEAEFIAKSPCCQNSNYVRRVINCAGIPGVRFRLASGLWSDNQSSIAIASNPVFHQRTKHIAIKYQYVNECVKNGTIVIKFVRSKDNAADVFTKPVGRLIFSSHYDMVMGWSVVPKIAEVVMTTEEDFLPCPGCAANVFCRDQRL